MILKGPCIRIIMVKNQILLRQSSALSNQNAEKSFFGFSATPLMVVVQNLCRYYVAYKGREACVIDDGNGPNISLC